MRLCRRTLGAFATGERLQLCVECLMLLKRIIVRHHLSGTTAFAMLKREVTDMLSGIISFLGGSAFRMIWGEVSKFIEGRQNHKYEIERLKLEEAMATQRHKRELEMLRLSSELGVREVQIKGDLDIQKEDAAAFREAMTNANRSSGVHWVDAWNGIIRPAFATVCLGLWVLSLSQRNWTMTPFDIELFACIVGFFFADRALTRRGK